MKGITPLVTVVMLVALAMITGVSIYYWVNSQSINQPIPQSQAVEISVTAVNTTAGEYLVTNVDVVSFNTTTLFTSSGDDCDFGSDTELSPGESAQCTIPSAPTGEIVFYRELIGPATIVV